MAKSPRILNITRGFHLKHSQAQRAVDAAACEWVEFGVSIRNLSLTESIAKRNQQAAERDPLAEAEISGLIFQLPERYSARNREESRLAWEANRFFETASV
jgi:hypothetical protein